MTMEYFKPTEEELFDYHLKRTTEELTEKIRAYVEAHPDVGAKLKEYDRLEMGFKNMSLSVPSEKILERVRQVARSQIRGQRPWFPGFAPFFQVRNLAWVTMIVLVIGLSYALKEMKDGYYHSVKPVVKQSLTAQTNGKMVSHSNVASVQNTELTEDNKDDLAAQMVEGAVQDVKSMTNSHDPDKLFSEAIQYFEDGQFKKASQLFSHIMTLRPDYIQKEKLLTYWIQALDQLDAQDLANEKRAELKHIQENQ